MGRAAEKNVHVFKELGVASAGRGFLRDRSARAAGALDDDGFAGDGGEAFAEADDAGADAVGGAEV